MTEYEVTLRTTRTIRVVVSGNHTPEERAIEAFHEDHAAGAESVPEIVSVHEVAPAGAIR